MDATGTRRRVRKTGRCVDSGRIWKTAMRIQNMKQMERQ